MSNVLVDKNKIDLLANAISAKSGESLTLTLDEMVEAVDGIETGGGGITPTGNIDITQAGVTDVTNYATATVPQGSLLPWADDWYATESGNRKWKLETGWIRDDGDNGNGWIDEDGTSIRTFSAVASGTTITPTTSSQTIGGANYMMEGAVTVSAMPTGTAGTPTATKGAVSNHSVSVTPSVTNTTGYISGGTKTGTAVTVSASELVSGSETKTSNGTYDVTNLASLVVNVSGGGSASIDTKTVTASNRPSSLSFTAMKGEPKAFFLKATFTMTSSSSTYYYVDSMRYNGTNTQGRLFRMGSTRQTEHVTTGYSWSYSGTTLTVTSTGSRTASPGCFYNGSYELVYIY